MEKLTERQVIERVDSLVTDELLTSLTTIARMYGWEGDYIEVRSFLEWIYNIKGVAEPDLDPYDIDEFNNTIIP